MPFKPKHPCNHPGCHNLTSERYCLTHEGKVKEQRREYDNSRGTAAQRGYDGRWAKARAAFLSDNSLCIHCSKTGRVTAATVVDHIIPHKGDMELFWNRDNWQSLCKTCHDVKTATEDGGFGSVGKGKPSKACGVDGIPSDSQHHWNK